MEIHLHNPIVVMLHPRESNVDFTNAFRLLSMNLLAHELCNLVKTNYINSLCFNFNESSRVWQNLPDLRHAMTFPSRVDKPSVQFSSVTQSCPTLCDPMNRSMPGLPVHHQLLEFTQNMCFYYITIFFLCFKKLMFLEPLKNDSKGTSLVVHWLRLWVLNAGALGLIPGQGTRSHTPKLRPTAAEKRNK